MSIYTLYIHPRGTSYSLLTLQFIERERERGRQSIRDHPCTHHTQTSMRKDLEVEPHTAIHKPLPTEVSPCINTHRISLQSMDYWTLQKAWRSSPVSPPEAPPCWRLLFITPRKCLYRTEEEKQEETDVFRIHSRERIKLDYCRSTDCLPALPQGTEGKEDLESTIPNTAM